MFCITNQDTATNFYIASYACNFKHLQMYKENVNTVFRSVFLMHVLVTPTKGHVLGMHKVYLLQSHNVIPEQSNNHIS